MPLNVENGGSSEHTLSIGTSNNTEELHFDGNKVLDSSDLGSNVGKVPSIGTDLGTTDGNILVTDSNGNLKSSGVTVDSISVSKISTTPPQNPTDGDIWIE